MSTDRIEKKVTLKAPIERVWRAIGDSTEFGMWFGVAFDGPFVEGGRLAGKIVPTAVDAEVAKLQEPYAGKAFEITVERVLPMRTFSFRWPVAADPDADYSKAPTTLVVFDLEQVPGGTLLTITESGFEAVPLEQRAKVFTSNEEGWSMQAKLIEKYLAMHPR